ncbi:MAG: hypothetical protein OES38_10630 [Gammaproteobacteria bacterium]|nr:hypothetical protein [Gammaproteobacteria bacterium]
MQLYLDHLATRVLGTVLGVGFVSIGLYALFAGGDGISEIERERALAFGITAIIGGLAAIFGSWAEKKLNEVWCAHPRRLPKGNGKDKKPFPPGGEGLG